jgi:hypothetical protein
MKRAFIASVSIATILGIGQARAEHGVVTAIHAGLSCYEFQLAGSPNWFAIPMFGTGYALQAAEVSNVRGRSGSKCSKCQYPAVAGAIEVSRGIDRREPLSPPKAPPHTRARRRACLRSPASSAPRPADRAGARGKPGPSRRVARNCGPRSETARDSGNCLANTPKGHPSDPCRTGTIITGTIGPRRRSGWKPPAAPANASHTSQRLLTWLRKG